MDAQAVKLSLIRHLFFFVVLVVVMQSSVSAQGDTTPSAYIPCTSSCIDNMGRNLEAGNYANCTDCSNYVSCNAGFLTNRLCPSGTFYYDRHQGVCTLDKNACFNDSLYTTVAPTTTTTVSTPETTTTASTTSVTTGELTTRTTGFTTTSTATPSAETTASRATTTPAETTTVVQTTTGNISLNSTETSATTNSTTFQPPSTSISSQVSSTISTPEQTTSTSTTPTQTVATSEQTTPAQTTTLTTTPVITQPVSTTASVITQPVSTTGTLTTAIPLTNQPATSTVTTITTFYPTTTILTTTPAQVPGTNTSGYSPKPGGEEESFWFAMNHYNKYSGDKMRVGAYTVTSSTAQSLNPHLQPGASDTWYRIYGVKLVYSRCPNTSENVGADYTKCPLISPGNSDQVLVATCDFKIQHSPLNSDSRRLAMVYMMCYK